MLQTGTTSLVTNKASKPQKENNNDCKKYSPLLDFYIFCYLQLIITVEVLDVFFYAASHIMNSKETYRFR